MNSYEHQQLVAIEEWKKKEPSVVTQSLSKILSPIAWGVNRIIPQKAIEGALTASNGLAEWITDEDDILRDAKVRSISELQTKNLRLSDQLANEVHNWALALLGAEGGATGWMGLPGMAVDIPMVVTLALRTIHKIGLCYGFKAQTEQDKLFVYTIMSAAGANTLKEKTASLLVLKQLNVIIMKQTWKKMAEKAAANKVSQEALITAIRQLAARLGINLTKRKALQAIPIVGAGVGAAMNVSFINDISWAARRCFQELWLKENGQTE